jgi:hypothetical protein
MNKSIKLRENSGVDISLKNLISIIIFVAVGVWAYFGVVETLNVHSTKLKLMENDLEKNTEFRIKWPRGELGSLPADSEQFMLLEHIAGQIEKHDKQLESGMHNKVNIDFLKAQIKKLQDDVELLKDKVRQNGVH